MLPLQCVAAAGLAPTGLRRSDGCGAEEPITPNWGPKRFSFQVEDATQPSGYATRWYWLQLPKVYDKHTPAALVLSFHGYYDNARDQIYEDSLPTVINRDGRNVVTVYPVGSSDVENDHDVNERYGWNIEGNGLNEKPGPMGPVCRVPRYHENKYACYRSCSRSRAGCNEWQGCNCASCMQDVEYIKVLLKRIESQVCVDLDRVHLTGISAGGLMVYQLALDLAGRVASVAPVAGSRLLGYNRRPAAPVALLDVHGYDDVYIPANTSHAPYYLSYDYADDYDSYDYASYTYAQRVAPAERARAARDERAHPSKGIDGPYDRSYQPARFFATAPRNGTARGGGGDGAAAPAALGPHGSVTSEDQFFYTPVPKITAAFAEANGCDFGGNLPRPTRWDGFREFSCNRPHGDCGASAVVQCVGRWGHTWPLSWFKMASTLSDGSAPSASLACLKARAAPTHPRAQPEHLGGLPWPQD